MKSRKKSSHPAKSKRPASAPAKTDRPLASKTKPLSPAKKTVVSAQPKPMTSGQAQPPAPSQPPPTVTRQTDRPAISASLPAKTAASKPALPQRAPVAIPPSRAAKPTRPRKPVVLPPILLEGDVPPAPDISGPGDRYVLAPEPPRTPAGPIQLPVELPEAYGTERLFLTARDPHWLYAAWDLTAQQRAVYSARSQDGHLVLRAHVKELGTTPVAEAKLTAEAKSWFLYVPHAGTRYLAEIGYIGHGSQWHTIAASSSTLTPAESISTNTAVEFATIPPNVTLKKLFEVVQEAVSDHVPLTETLQQLRTEGWTQLPETMPSSAPAWTPAQVEALAAVVRVDESRRVWMGSVEITELVRRHLQQDISSAGLPGAAGAGPGLPIGQPISSFNQGEIVSSPARLAEEAPSAGKFWMSLNAELVLYGATEPDAKVRVSGREIRLRPDGTFSYRFALPDGQFSLTFTAESATRTEQRMAKLEFRRRTEYQGDVQVHPQDVRLQTPEPNHIS